MTSFDPIDALGEKLFASEKELVVISSFVRTYVSVR